MRGRFAPSPTGFLHVGGAPFGSVAPLSGFLTGINVNDRANRPPPPFQHHFADLEQRRVREQALGSGQTVESRHAEVSLLSTMAYPEG